MTKATVMVPNVFTSEGKFFEGDIIEISASEIKEINEIRAGALKAEAAPVSPAKKSTRKS